MSELAIHRANSASDEFPAYWRAEALPIVEVHTRARLSRLAWFSIGILLFAALAVSAIYMQRASILQAGLVPVLAVPNSVTAPTQTSQQSSVAADANRAGISATSLPFPLPSDYGVYALANAELTELQFLSEQVPDKRVAISTPITRPSHTTLRKPKFLVFRRDLAGNALDRIEVRLVALVARRPDIR